MVESSYTWSRAVRPLPIAWPYLVVVAVALLLLFGEIDRMAAQSLSSEGRTFSISAVIGLGAAGSVGQWQGWTDPDGTTPGGMLLAHVAVDLLFIAVYASLAVLAIRRMTRGRRQDVAGVLLVLLLAVDVVEDALLGVGGALLASRVDVAPPMATGIAAVSTLKIGLLLALLAAILGSARVRQGIVHAWRRLRIVLHAHRLTAILVVALAVLSLIPWGLVLEQLPDLQRGWVDDGRGVRHLVFAGIVTVTLMFTFRVIGRKRSEMYWQDLTGRIVTRTPRTYDRDALAAHPALRTTGVHLLGWLAVPAIVIAAALWVRSVDPDLLDPAPLSVFLIVFAVLLGGSGIAEAVFRRRWIARGRPAPELGAERSPDRARRDRATAYDIIHGGDYLAGAILMIAGLGLARSFAPLTLLGVIGGIGPAETAGAAVLVLAGVAVALVTLALVRRALIRPGTGKADPGGAETGMTRMRTWLDPRSPSRPDGWRTGLVVAVATVTSFAILIAVVGLPELTGGLIGAVAVTVGLLGAWLTLVALFTLWMRRRRPLALFHAMGLRSDPILTLFVLVPLVVGQLAGSSTLHAIDRTSQSAPTRLTLEQAFDSWVATNADCPAPGGVRPLLLVAAEGGGIRAATWTVDALSQLTASGGCAASSVFLSSGVSGGSIGLAITATAPEQSAATDDSRRDAQEALREKVRTLSDSAALPSAISGLLVSDPLAATTGVRFPTFAAPTEWRDRAALIESSWRDADPDLAVPFDGSRSSGAGWVVLNATDVRSGCRVIVSQIDFGTGTGSTSGNRNGAPRCDEGVDEPPLTIDLLNYFRDGCDFNVDWATASLLSARFPVVTPAGGTGNEREACTNIPRLQLIDGGYAENSGLGLLADVSPRIASVVQEYNSRIRDRGEPQVVPYLLYIQNSPGGYIAEGQRADVPELTVPLVGQGTGANQVAASSWIQRIMTSLEPICQEPRCRIGTPSPPTVAERTVILAIGTEPSVTVPLGWALSDATSEQLRRDADRQGDPGCEPPEWSAYSCFGSYLGLFD